MGKRVLTEEQIEFIKQHHGSLSCKELAFRLQTSYRNVHNIIRLIPLQTNNKHTRINRPPAVYSNKSYIDLDDLIC